MNIMLDRRSPVSSTLARDGLAIAGLLIMTLSYLFIRVQWHSLPMEDALMLMRYSAHLAHGYGIRWNVGEPPVEGATDFLFMFLIGMLSKLTGYGVILISRMLLVLGHLGSVVLLYLGARRLFHWPIWASACLSVYLAVDLATAYIQTGFSAPFFAFLAMGAWYQILRCIVSGATLRKGFAIGICLLLTGLTRPEGVFVSAFLLLALIFAKGRRSLPAVLPATAVLVFLGGAYFLWRWHYFGYLLPNPFYLKGGGHFYWGSLSFAFSAVLIMLAPALLLLLVELFSPDWKRAATVLIPTIGFTCIWVLLSNENNHFMRFQYCIVPLTLLSVPYASNHIRKRFRDFSLAPPLQMAAIFLAVGSAVYWQRLSRVPPSDTGLYDIASALKPFKDRNYTIAVTEAGILPYFSDWRAVDLYGLNDSEIVHNPHGLSQRYLEQRNPVVILYHQPPRGAAGPIFDSLTDATSRFAASHNYELAAAWGYSLCDRHIWYVRRDVPEAARFIAIIRKSPYFITGYPMIDLTHVPLPTGAQCSDPGTRLSMSQ